MHDTTEIEKRYAPPTARGQNSVDGRITVEGADVADKLERVEQTVGVTDRVRG